MLEYVFLDRYGCICDRIQWGPSNELILFISEEGGVDRFDSFFIGTKPEASDPNYLGDTEVSHYQLHGTCFSLPTNWSVNGKGQYVAVERHPKGSYRNVVFDYLVTPNSPSVTRYYDYHGYYKITTFGGPYMGILSTELGLRSGYLTLAVMCQVYDRPPVERPNGFWPCSKGYSGVIPEYHFTYEDRNYKVSSFTPQWLSSWPLKMRDKKILYIGYTWTDEAMSLAKDMLEYYHTCFLQIAKSPTWGFYGGYGDLVKTSADLSVQQLFSLRKMLIAELPDIEPSYDLSVLAGDATQSAADSVLAFEGNSLPLIKELLQIKDTFRDLLQLLQGDVSIDNLANLWLSARYGLRLTFSDLHELILAIKKQLETPKKFWISDCRGVAYDSSVVARAKLYYDTFNRNAFADVMNFLMVWDLFPSLTNAWDIIPYSFVVDWFADIEGFLSAYDARTFLSTLNVFKCCYTFKHTWVIPSTCWHGLYGQIEVSHFIRETPDVPWQPVPHFSGSLPSAINIVDGAALIIQRRKAPRV